MRKLILFTLLSISLIGCKKKEEPIPYFNIVGTWHTRGIVSMNFYPDGRFNTGYKYSITTLTYPHYLVNTYTTTTSDKFAIKVLNPDKFEVVNGNQTLERVK